MNQQLPRRPSLEQLKKQAKSLLKSAKTGEPDSLARIRIATSRAAKELLLADAQRAVAREYGFQSWAKLKQHVAALLAPSADPQLIDPFLRAAATGDLEAVAKVLGEHPELIDERGGNGTRTALHFAAMQTKRDVVGLLLEHGADPNIRCEGDSAFPIHFAAEKDDFETIKLLVEHGSDTVGDDDYHELQVIGWATCFGSAKPEIVDYLLAHGAHHTMVSAVACGNVAEIRQIAERNPEKLNARMERASQRRRPLHLAVVKNQPAALKTLSELGADLEALDDAMLTPLDQAALSGQRVMAEMLVAAGAKIRMPSAIYLGRADAIKSLLRREPDALKPGRRWGTLIVRAAEHASGEVIERLVDAGASVNVRDDTKTSIDSTSGFTALHAAAWYGNSKAAEALIRLGADVTAREERYQGSPAGWAHYAGKPGVRDLILRGPVDIFDAIEFDLNDRLEQIIATEAESIDKPMIEYLIAPSPLPEIASSASLAPLAFAAARGKAGAVRRLLAAGATTASTLRELAEKSGDAETFEVVRQAMET